MTPDLPGRLRSPSQSAQAPPNLATPKSALLAWLETCLGTAGKRYHADLPDRFELPKVGPLIVLAHPASGVNEQAALGHFLAQQRTDLCFWGGSLPTAPKGIALATPPNALDSALRHAQNGGVLVVFLAAEAAAESAPSLAWLLREAGAALIPVSFSQPKPTLLQSAGALQRSLRARFGSRSARTSGKRPLLLRIGQPVPFAKLKKITDDERLLRFVRLHTLVLASRATVPAAQKTPHTPSAPQRTAAPDFHTPPDHQLQMLAEVRSVLDAGGELLRLSSLSVLVAEASQIPWTLQEIGRQREITFRAVGEGTGQEIDLDRFDPHYLHLFLWDHDKKRLAGAYRMGRADIILRQHGRRGLYTSTLFKFRKPFLSHLSDAVEMGRSFIVQDYQRHASALPMLWKGICVWITRNPQYRKLFGPVSISQDYHNLSRNLMIKFLKHHRLHSELAPHVKPRNPFKQSAQKQLMREFISADLQDVEDCSALVSSLETDQKGIPTLLKHYLRLNGSILSFNVDKAFSSVVDGLILIDLTRTDPRLLCKYMGEDACRAYLAQHDITFSAGANKVPNRLLTRPRE